VEQTVVGQDQDVHGGPLSKQVLDAAMVLDVCALFASRILIAVHSLGERLNRLAYVFHFPVAHKGVQNIPLRRMPQQLQRQFIVDQVPVDRLCLSCGGAMTYLNTVGIRQSRSSLRT